MTFDMGFEADYHLFSRWGGGGFAGPYEVDLINRQGGGSAMVPGSSGAGSYRPASGRPVARLWPAPWVRMHRATALTQSLDFAIDDYQRGGSHWRNGAADPVAAAAVTTGMEFSIALADLGNPGPGDVLGIAAIINNGNHDFLSNQVLGGLPAGTPNLGGPGGVDFNQYPDAQLFRVVVPEPGTFVLLGAALCLLARFGRRSESSVFEDSHPRHPAGAVLFARRLVPHSGSAKVAARRRSPDPARRRSPDLADNSTAGLQTLGKTSTQRETCGPHPCRQRRKRISSGRRRPSGKMRRAVDRRARAVPLEITEKPVAGRGPETRAQPGHAAPAGITSLRSRPGASNTSAAARGSDTRRRRPSRSVPPARRLRRKC